MKMIVTVILVLLIVALWSWGLIEMRNSRAFLDQAKVAAGKVVSEVMRSHSANVGSGAAKGGTVAGGSVQTASTFPVIEFVAEDGSTHRFEAHTSADNVPREGLEVLYWTTDPANARIRSFPELWIKPIAAGILGLMAAVALLIVRIYSRQ